MPQEVKFLDLMASKHVWAFGGMRTLPEPHLLAADEAANAKDCDVSSGALKPAKKNAVEEATVAGYVNFTRLKDQSGGDEWPAANVTASYYHWNDHLVVTYDGQSQRPFIIYNDAGGYNTAYLGITPPDIVGNGTAGEIQARNIYDCKWYRGDVKLGAGDYTNAANDSIADDVPLLIPADDSGYAPATGDNLMIQVDSDCEVLVFNTTTASSTDGSYYFQWQYEKNDGTWVNCANVSAATTILTVTGNHELSWDAATDRNILDGKVRYRAVLSMSTQPSTYPKAGRIFQAPLNYTGDPTSAYPFFGRYKYKVTYVNETRGVESAPQSPNRTDAAIVVDVKAPAESIIINDITNPPYKSGSDFYAYDPSGFPDELPVEKVYLYRTAADGEIYYKLTDAAPSGSGGGPLLGAANWEDTTADIDLVRNKEMDAELNYLPGYLDDGGGTFILGGVAGGIWPKGICFHDGRFFCVGGGAAITDWTTVFWSRPDNPHAWPLQQFLKLPTTIQGLFSTDMGLLAFTERGPYILYPGEWDPTSLTKKYIPHKIPGNWDCRSIHTCCMTPYGVMWASRNAIVVWNGAGEPRDLTTKDFGDVPLDSATYLSACFYKQQYLLFSDIGTLILDFRKTGSPQARLWGWDGEVSPATNYKIYDSYYDPEDDEVFVLTKSAAATGKVWKWEEASSGTRASDYMALEYTTGEYGGETMERLKWFDRVEIGSDTTDADGYVNLLVDGSSVESATLSNSGRGRDVVFFPVNQTGHKSQLTFSGRANAIYDAALYYYPDSLFSQDTIFHYMQVTTNTSSAVAVYVDGSNKTLAGGTIAAAGMHHVFFGSGAAMNVRGRHPQVRWTNNAVTDIRLFYSPESEFSQQRIWHGCKVTIADSTSCQVKIYMDGTLKTTSSAFSAAGEYDIFFPANTRGVLPQWSATASNVTNVTWISDEEKTFSERRIFHGAKVTVSGNDTVTLYMDGSADAGGAQSLSSGAGEYYLFFTPITRGVLPQFISTGSNVTKVEWISDPDGAFKDRMVITGVKCMVNAVCTIYLYVDGALETTYTASLYRTGEHTIFCPANTHGRVYQLQWTVNGVDDESIEWMVEPDHNFGKRLLVKGINVAWDGDLTFNAYVDGGAADLTTTLSGTVETHDSEEFEFLPPVVGFIPQFTFADLSTTEAGYLHKAEWNVEEEPPQESSVNSLTGTQRGYVYRVGVVYWGSVTFKAYLDDVERTDISTSLTTYDSTDWQTVFLEANPASGLPIASKLVWDNEGAGFVRQVLWDVAPDRRMEETIPSPGTPGRYYLKGFFVTYIGAGTLNIFLGGSSSATVTQSLSSVSTKTRVHYYFPQGTFANVVQYDYSETSKNSLFVFNVEWVGALIP